MQECAKWCQVDSYTGKNDPVHVATFCATDRRPGDIIVSFWIMRWYAHMCERRDEGGAYELMQRGRELLEEGHPMQAAIILENARSEAPRKGSILELLGRAYYSSGRYEKAIERFAEALDVDPSNDYAHYCLGLCFLKTRRRSEAAGHFKLAWFLRPVEIYREKAAWSGAAGSEAGPAPETS